MKFRHFTRMRTDLDDGECRRRLLASIDLEQRILFSLSWYKGSKPVIGRLNAVEFRLHKRRYWHNDFAPECYGSFVSEGNGTMVECYFDVPRWSRKFMRVWLGFTILIGIPIFILSCVDLLKTHNYISGNEYLNGSEYVGFLVPVVMVLFGIFMPKVGLFLSKSEEEFILAFLRRTLNARTAE